MNNRPWRDLIDVKEMDWTDWEERFAHVDGDVRTVASSPSAPAPADKPRSIWNRPTNHIGRVPKKTDPKVHG